MEGFQDDYRQELFEELMVQWEIEQERHEILRRSEDEEQLHEEEEAF